MTMGQRPRAAILGCAGPELTADERSFFADSDPLGFILFARNCREPVQVRDLVAAFRAEVGRPDAPVLIDQEGGRVQRLGPPHWRKRPPQAVFARLYAEDADAGLAAARTNARLIAWDLKDLGIDVDCLPLLDVPQPSAHDIIGDRAYGADPVVTAALGRAVCEGLAAGGVTAIVKHIPGHGRAQVDSHLQLPVVDAGAEILEAVDFAPFKALADALDIAPWAMTAHVVYRAFDAERPATTSQVVIETVIRGLIGFDGFLISDDLGMKALGGDFGDRAAGALAAGCDAVLHCSGDTAEMRAVMARTPVMTDAAWTRFRRGLDGRPEPDDIQREELEAELAERIASWK